MMTVEVPSDQRLIHVWESGRALHPLDQALRILAATCPQATWNDLATLSMSRRNHLLLQAYQRLAGKRLEGLSQCPQCGDEVEFAIDVTELLDSAGDAPPPSTVPESYCLELVDHVVHYRALNSLDVASALRCSDFADGRLELVRRCIVAVQRRDESLGRESAPAEPLATADLTTEMISAVGDWLDRREPLAIIGFEVDCPSCERHWTAAFDVVPFVWNEIASRAKRLLYEVHLLARAYGWSETAILELTPERRQSYLQWI